MSICDEMRGLWPMPKKEIDYILNVYEDNGHNRKNLEAIIKNYMPPNDPKRNQEAGTGTSNRKDGSSCNRGNNTDDASTLASQPL
jgi:hypothetical protein